MTKAAHIMELYRIGLATGEIARIVGCLPSYVRVVARQRMGSGSSEIDRRYLTSPLGRERQKRLRTKRLAYWSAIRDTADKAKASSAARAARSRAIAHGASAREAQNAAKRARERVQRQTCNKRLVRDAYREAVNET